jgi:tight adherence protein B
MQSIQQVLYTFTGLIGLSGVCALVALMIFMFSYRYGQKLFAWIEHNTEGTREYLIEKLNILFYEIAPEKITRILLIISFGVGIGVFILCGLFSLWAMGIVLGVVLGILGWKIPRPLVDYLVERRIKAYQGQMVDGLTLLANGLRAGLSVPQALALVVGELPNPISQEFNLILQQNRIGVPIEECFENLGKRLPSEDNDMFVTSVNILRETGGNLAETFETIVDVIRERVRVQQKIDGIISRNKMQANVLFCMPVVLFGISYAMDPKVGHEVLSSWVGLTILGISLAIDCVGMWVISKIIKIKC